MTRSHRKLTTIALGIALALGGCTTVSDTRESRPAAISATAPAAAGPALWKVADADTTIYLFGTVHALPKDVDWYSGPVAQALGGAQVLVTEIPSAALKEPATQQKFLAAAMLPPGQTLRALLGADQRVQYEGAMTKLGLPVAAFDQFEPWFAALTLGTIPILKAGYTLEAGVEQAVEGKAAATTQRAALETVEGQLALFDGMPQAAQVEYLISVSKQVDTVVPTMNDMVKAWSQGDAERLALLMNQAMDDPVLVERLLYARNRNWAQWVAKRLGEPGTVFVAVGAGHLAGANSVQDYLTKAGTAVVRVQ